MGGGASKVPKTSDYRFHVLQNTNDAVADRVKKPQSVPPVQISVPPSSSSAAPSATNTPRNPIISPRGAVMSTPRDNPLISPRSALTTPRQPPLSTETPSSAVPVMGTSNLSAEKRERKSRNAFNHATNASQMKQHIVVTTPDTTIVEIKKPLLQKTNSHPELLTERTVFCPYIDIEVKGHGLNHPHMGKTKELVQRSVTKKKASILGEGKFNYKHFDYFEYSNQFPWLIKNMFLLKPQLKDFAIGRTIGAGRSSQIILSKIQDYTCIIKKIPKSFIFEQGELKHILNERDTLYASNSPFLMKLFAEIEDAQYAYFICEYVPGGELRSVMNDYVLFSEDMTFFYACEIVVALEHLYDHHIVYRDLVPENICIDEYGHIKLVDFGSSIDVNYNANGKLYTLCLSSPKYLSPEQLNSKYEGGYGAEVDWWALGICLYEFITGKTPFVKNEKEDLQYEILIRILRHKLSFPVTFPSSLKDLVNKLLTPTMDTRLYVPKLVKQHTYFTSRLPNWDCVVERRLAPPFVPKLSFDHYDSNHFSMSQKSKKHWKLGVLENDVKLL